MPALRFAAPLLLGLAVACGSGRGAHRLSGEPDGGAAGTVDAAPPLGRWTLYAPALAAGHHVVTLPELPDDLRAAFPVADSDYGNSGEDSRTLDSSLLPSDAAFRARPAAAFEALPLLDQAGTVRIGFE